MQGDFYKCSLAWQPHGMPRRYWELVWRAWDPNMHFESLGT
jgi:hypothetical protein